MVVWLGLVLILVSGLIAYVGDVLGRRIGRRRLSIFGLRPRNTAILFTVVTGMLIALLTAGVLLGLSTNLRDRILHHEEIVADLRRQAGLWRQQATQRQAELREMLQRLDSAQRERSEAERELSEAEVAVEEAATAQRTAEAQAQAAGRQAAATTRDLVAARTRVEQARAELSTARERRDEAVARLDAVRDAADRARLAAEEAIERYEATLRELAQTKRELGGAEQDLSYARGELERVKTQIDQANEELAGAQKQLTNAVRILREMDDRATEIQDRLEIAQEQYEALLREAARSMQGRVIFDAGGELGRRRFDGARSREDLLDELAGFVRTLDRLAASRGAGPDSTGAYAVPLGIAAAGQVVDAAIYLPAMVEALRREGRPVWLRAVSLLNTIGGRPAFYTFEPYADRVIFLAGEGLATTVVDGRQDEASIARALEDLVRGEVAERARSAGMLPNPEGRVTNVGPEVWLPAVQQIRRLGRPVTVTVTAAREIRIGDTLDISFQVATNGGNPGS